jgi:hypothetical protein
VSTVAELMQLAASGEMSPVEAADAAFRLVNGAVDAPPPAVATTPPAPVGATPPAAPAFNPYAGRAGDPTIEEYLALTPQQQAELDDVLPGVEERLTKAGAWNANSQREAARAAAEAEQAEYQKRVLTDPAFAAAESAKQSARHLDVAWGSLSNQDRLDLKEDAGMTDEDFAALLAKKQAWYEEMNS